MKYDDETLHELLKTHFGWQRFQSVQLEAIKAILDGKNVFVRSATGSGKSLIWQLATLAREYITGENKLTVVVYPTKALLLEQGLKLSGIKSLNVVSLHGDQTPQEKGATLDRIELTSSELPDILLTVPEYMKSINPNYSPQLLPPLLDRLQQKGKLALIVIDEAQQVLQWGESFRGPYLDFANVISDFFPKIPRLALSAAITEKNMKRTVEKLNMKDAVFLHKSLDSPSVYHEVRMKEGKHISVYGKDIRDLLQKGQGIIYCTTRKDAMELALGLLQVGIEAGCYHGGLDSALRASAVVRWINGEISVLVATVAFMFGIDNQKVRWVIWDSLPSSVENWVQGSGRAGRDGKKAWSIVYYKPSDQDMLKNLELTDNPFELESLNRVTDILHDTVSCRRSNILSYLGEGQRSRRCNNCDTCLSPNNTDSSTDRNVIEGGRNIVKILQRMARWSKKEWIETRSGVVDAVLGKKTRRLLKYPPNWDDHLFGCQINLSPRHGQMNTEEITILITELIKVGVLEEKQISPSSRWKKHSYLKLGPEAEALLSGTKHIQIPFPINSRTKMTNTLKPTWKKVEVSILRRRLPFKSQRDDGLKVIREVIGGKKVDCIVID